MPIEYVLFSFILWTNYCWWCWMLWTFSVLISNVYGKWTNNCLKNKNENRTNYYIKLRINKQIYFYSKKTIRIDFIIYFSCFVFVLKKYNEWIGKISSGREYLLLNFHGQLHHILRIADADNRGRWQGNVFVYGFNTILQSKQTISDHIKTKN